MATLYKEIAVNSPATRVWDAVRDFGSVHVRLVPGFVTDCRTEADAAPELRIVTFFNGNTARERLIGIDEPARRLAYAVVGGSATHHNASVQVFADGPTRCRFVWITDLLPDELAAPFDAMMEQGAIVIKKTLER